MSLNEDAELAAMQVPPHAEVADDDLSRAIVEQLRHVYDPEIPANIYELGLIYKIVIEENGKRVFIEMTLTTPACPVAGEMPGWVIDAVKKADEGIEIVDVELVWDPPWNPTMMAETAKLQLNIPYEGEGF